MSEGRDIYFKSVIIIDKMDREKSLIVNSATSLKMGKSQDYSNRRDFRATVFVKMAGLVAGALLLTSQTTHAEDKSMPLKYTISLYTNSEVTVWGYRKASMGIGGVNYELAPNEFFYGRLDKQGKAHIDRIATISSKPAKSLVLNSKMMGSLALN